MRKPSLRTFVPAMPAFLFFLTTVIGAVRWFSPVPFWDMWDGTLQFYVARLQGAHWSPFLEQANEHRIILSKILFWIDYRFFGGLSYFLIFANIVLMLALWLTLCVAARALMEAHRRLAYLCCALIAVPCFSWLQSENINWGYQSQFYMAYLLPLLALLSMARWVHDPARTRWLVTATLLGMLSTITMANGILALPLLIIMLAVSGQCTKWRLGGLLLVSAATIGAWLYHYHRMPHDGAPFRMMAKFLLMFFGAPFGWIFHNDLLTMLAGAAVIVASFWLAVQWLRGATRNPAYLALVIFVAHIGAAGAAATIGRANFGLGAALAGRYETPLMLLYSTLLLLFAHLYRDRVSTSAVVGALSVFTPLMLFTAQLGAIDPAGPAIARQRMQAVLALDLGVDDREAIGRIYPEESSEQRERVRGAASNAMRYNLSAFGLPDMRTIRELIGKAPAKLHPCKGNVDWVGAISDPRHVAIKGWAFDDRSRRVPKAAYLVSGGVVTGAALTGDARPDVAAAVDQSAVRSGFEGYANVAGKDSLSVFCED